MCSTTRPTTRTAGGAASRSSPPARQRLLLARLGPPSPRDPARELTRYAAGRAQLLQQLLDWARAAHAERRGGGAPGRDADILLLAHSGAQWAHEVLLRGMLDEDVAPPAFRLADPALCCT